MKEGERAARAQGTQGIGDDIAAAEPGPGFHETPPEVNRLARRVIESAVAHGQAVGRASTNLVFLCSLRPLRPSSLPRMRSNHAVQATARPLGRRTQRSLCGEQGGGG